MHFILQTCKIKSNCCEFQLNYLESNIFYCIYLY